MLKNVAGSSFDEINLENGFRILEFQNESDETLTFERNIDSTFIQMHFCIKGNSKFLFNNGSYSICEVNSSPGFEGMDKFTKTNIAEDIVNFVKLKIGYSSENS